MSKTTRAINPFYVLLVVLGFLFTITACSYFVMTLQASQYPVDTMLSIESGEGFLAIMDRNGPKMMLVELVALAIATVAAIGTDQFWKRQAETKEKRLGDTTKNEDSQVS